MIVPECGRTQFLARLTLNEPPHPSPRPSPLWYVSSVPEALHAWSPGFSLALAGCVSGQAQYPNTSVGRSAG